MIAFEGFAPDLPPETPGIFTECTNVIPSINKYIGAPTPVDAGLGAITSACVGFAVTRTSSNTARVFCGDSATLYEQSGTWTDVSKIGGYAAGPDDRWRFAQFGDVTLATCKSETIQAITSGDFADADATAPKSAIVETINNQVFAFNINGMGFGDQADRWACSALGDYTDWTPSVATQCASGQFLDSPGGITAGKRLGDIIVAYKDRAMYIGQYVGAPMIWDFRRVPGDIGTPCNESVINTGTAHYFIGNDDFYIFDGTRPQSLNSPLRQWFFTELDQANAYKICGTYDAINKRAYWWYPSRSSNGALNDCIVLHTATGKWGKISLSVEYVADYVAAGMTYESLGTAYSTYDDLPTDVSFDSPFWNSGSSVLAVFKTDHKAYQLSGTAAESRFTTGHYGDNINFSTISRIRPRFLGTPNSSTMNYSHSNTDAETFTNNLTSTYSNGWYDLLWSARWHKFEFVFNGPFAISGFDPLLSQDGSE